MRKSKTIAVLLQALCFISCGFSAVAVADNGAFVAQEKRAENQWMCGYTRAASDILYLRCDNFASLMHDPLITDEAEESVTKFIPIWRKPNNDESAARLATAILCHQSTSCEVNMNSLFYQGRIANR